MPNYGDLRYCYSLKEHDLSFATVYPSLKILHGCRDMVGRRHEPSRGLHEVLLRVIEYKHTLASCILFVFEKEAVIDKQKSCMLLLIKVNIKHQVRK